MLKPNKLLHACREETPRLWQVQAFILYEEAIPDSKAEITALQSIVGTLHKCRVFAPENRDVLVHKATGYSAKLLKKADQCRAVCTCSNLFWQEEVSHMRSVYIHTECVCLYTMYNHAM